MIDFIELTELYRKGLPPVAGGSLDQSSVFVHAFRFLRHEQARYRSELDESLSDL